MTCQGCGTSGPLFLVGRGTVWALLCATCAAATFAPKRPRAR